jgi:hypothetical protein
MLGMAELPVPGQVSERLLDALRHEDDQWLWELAWDLNAQVPGVGAELLVVIREASARPA